MSADDELRPQPRSRRTRPTAPQTYEWGFSSDIEQEFAPKGLSEDTVRFISAKKNEPEWMLEWRLKAYRAWLTMEEVSWAKLDIPPIDFQDAYYYAEPKAKPKLGSARRGRSRNPARLREARHPDRGAEGARRGRGRAQGRGRRGVRQRLGRHHLPRGAEEGRASSSSRISEAIREYPELVRKYLGSVVPQRDNYFACLNSAVFSDGTFVYMPEGVRCPMELQHLFPDQCREYRPVRAHPDRRRQGQLRLLSRRLHRADARREPAPRRRGRDLSRSTMPRSNIRPSRTGIRATPRARAASTISSPSARCAAATARRSAGPRSRPAARSPGNIRAASSRARAASANSIRSR